MALGDQAATGRGRLSQWSGTHPRRPLAGPQSSPPTSIGWWILAFSARSIRIASHRATCAACRWSSRSRMLAFRSTVWRQRSSAARSPSPSSTLRPTSDSPPWPPRRSARSASGPASRSSCSWPCAKRSAWRNRHPTIGCARTRWGSCPSLSCRSPPDFGRSPSSGCSAFTATAPVGSPKRRPPGGTPR